MALDAAQQALLKAHLSFGHATYRYDDRVARGVVLSSDPPAGAERKRGSAVDLVVSRGPRPIHVPDLTGEPVHRAKHQLAKLHLTAHVTWRHSDSVPKGEVISQSPDSGTLFRDQTVELVGSKGPVMVEVPRVTGMGVEDATNTLEAAGFQVHTAQSKLYVGLGYVVDTDPKHGEMAPQGSVIVIFLV